MSTSDAGQRLTLTYPSKVLFDESAQKTDMETHRPQFLINHETGVQRTVEEPAAEADVWGMFMFPSSLTVIKPSTHAGRFFVNITPQYAPRIPETWFEYLKHRFWPNNADEHDQYVLPYYHIGRFAFNDPQFDLHFYLLLPRFHDTDRLTHKTNPGNLREAQLAAIFDRIIIPSIRLAELSAETRDVRRVYKKWSSSYKVVKSAYNDRRNNRPVPRQGRPWETELPCGVLGTAWGHMVAGGNTMRGEKIVDFCEGRVLFACHNERSSAEDIITSWAHFRTQWYAAIDQNHIGPDCVILHDESEA